MQRGKFLKATLIAAVAAVALLGAQPSSAKTFTWANDGDVNSMDPYARNETFLLSFMANIYEPLARRNRDLKLEPALAEKWTQVNPTLWRFNLRHNVKFQGGEPFTADDVVFSYARAMGKGSNVSGNFTSVKDVRKVDDFTVEIDTKYPDPLLVDKLAQIGIMSKIWAEKHNATSTADMTKNEENFATRNANGTGPFVVVSREPDVKTVLEPNKGWWDKPEHNLTKVVFQRIANDATRVAALLSGEIDMIYTVPPQDTDRIAKTPGRRIIQGPETRVVFLGFNQQAPELPESNIKGKNPFKDKRVREAFYRAIDVEAIKRTVMRGQSQPTALMIGQGLNGYMKDLDVRPKYDPVLSKKLLAEAGYPNGFETGMDCPNDRYVKDAAICQAVVSMLAKIGVKVNLLAQTRSKYFAKILRTSSDIEKSPNTSFYMLGWSPGATYDVHNVFESLIQTPSAKTGKGLFNAGGYSNPKFDALADKIEQETDIAKRNEMIKEATKIYLNDYAYIPLHQQVLVWAAKDTVDLFQPADNYFPLRFVKVK
ncbi:MAG TPA: ABC transporter substrate-binding protein [Ferrovibrio sp.]|jgi:peptide/nickel transport system substrate-binding protein|uniref:ABC transporter substrate-binding protein n=1 Tax=Ferrovibrio sp. TaxID=1917215 RepID=UPI002ECFF52B